MRIDQLDRLSGGLTSLAQGYQKRRQSQRNKERFDSLQDFFDDKEVDELDRLRYTSKVDNDYSNIGDAYDSYSDDLDKKFDRGYKERDYNLRLKDYNRKTTQAANKAQKEAEKERRQKRLDTIRGIKAMKDLYGGEHGMPYDPNNPNSRIEYEMIRNSAGLPPGYVPSFFNTEDDD